MNFPLADGLKRLWPRGLFWRVFFTIGIAVLISALCSLGLFSISSQRHLERVFAQDYTGLSAQVRQALDDGTLIELQTEFNDQKHAMLVVIEGRQPLGKRPPAWIMKKLRRKPSDRRDRNDHHGPIDFELMQSRLEHRGKRYRIIILPLPNDIRDTARPFGILTFITMLTLTSSLIAWMFSKPLRAVQSAARQLSTGDTTARVSDRVARRRDSIGELGTDFNMMAERIQQLLDAQQQLLRDVSHELRTPLARMQVALVLAQDNPASTSKQLTRIDSEIARLDQLIGSILSLCKVGSGAVALDEEQVDLIELLTQLAKDAEFEFAQAGITVRVQGNATNLHADRQQLHSALENIVRNAMRFSPNNSHIDLKVEQQAEALLIQVSDQGPGVEPSQLEHLFEPFYRVEKARSAQKTGGHGVGLAIARSIILLHGGDISASNGATNGLEVSITLPLSRLVAAPL